MILVGKMLPIEAVKIKQMFDLKKTREFILTYDDLAQNQLKKTEFLFFSFEGKLCPQGWRSHSGHDPANGVRKVMAD